MAANERKAAQDIIETKMLGRFTQAYLPLGDLKITFSEGRVFDYVRTLDFETATVSVSYTKEGVGGIRTESFCSFPDDVFVWRVVSDAPISFGVRLRSPLRCQRTYEGAEIRIEGRAPSDVEVGDVYNFTSDNTVSYDETGKSLSFAAGLRVITDGDAAAGDAAYENVCRVKNSKETTILFSNVTDFQDKILAGVSGESLGRRENRAIRRDCLAERCKEILDAASARSYRELRDAHRKYFGKLYGRFTVELGNPAAPRFLKPSENIGAIDGRVLATLLQYGRYLLISSSAPGTQPANLQGIWNRMLIAPWWSNYTLNINLQMNYWLAWKTGLSECAEPLLAFVKRLRENGRATARSYGLDGFVSHHQTDIWAMATPVGFSDRRVKDSASWAMWNMSGAWLCTQLFEGYLYMLDQAYLAEVYDLMKDCDAFLAGYMTERDGALLTSPSTSPENMYLDENGNRLAVCESAAMDIGVLTEFYRSLSAAAKISGDAPTAAHAERVLGALPPYKEKDGRLLEWDGDFGETEPGHRHFSMLYGIYPGDHLLRTHKESAKNALDRRIANGSASTGWSAAWATALYARLGNADSVKTCLLKLLNEQLHPNYFGAHPPDYFQIDTNFGLTAALCELIIRDCGGVIYPLPILLDEMREGKMSGFRIKGGHTLRIEWSGDRIEMVLEASSAAPIKALMRSATVFSGEATIAKSAETGLIEFTVEKGKTYTITGERYTEMV
jgi:alpha-L-fucosidase 2